MPNLLKKLMKSGPKARQGREPNISQAEISVDDLTDLAQSALGRTARGRKKDKHDRARKTAEYLADKVEDGVIRRSAAEALGTKRIATKANGKQAVVVAATSPPVARWVGDDGQKVLTTVMNSLGAIDRLKVDGAGGDLAELLARCARLLVAQRDEVKDVLVYMERGRYPALRTLRQVYERVLMGLEGLSGLDLDSPTANSELSTLVQLLEEGPDYLIDTFLVELIIHHAETLDTALAVEIRDIHKQAVAKPGDLAAWRRAAGGIVAYACAIPEEDLEDEMGRAAYRSIGVLVRQLKDRVEGEAKSVDSSSDTATRTPAPGSRGRTCSDEVERLESSVLQARFGTGPLPSPTIPPLAATTIGTPDEPLLKARKAKPEPDSPAPAPVSPASSASSISLYDYRGQILTASALDLVLRQEALALADSTGQYTGEVSWDDIRKTWIPSWVVKLKPEDLAPGEIPSTNHADYEVRREDEFGNKIGWTDEGELYYEEEPTFELK